MSRFIERFQTNIFIDNDFLALQSSLSLLKLLLQYHAPEIGCYLEQVGVTPELYAIPWFVAYMATKFPALEVLLEFWENIVARNEPCFIFFFLVSFLISNSRKIKAADVAKLPETMTSLKINTSKDLEAIFTQAEQLKLRTPHSFTNLPEINAIFTKNHPGLPQACQRLESLPCLPLVSTEVLFYAFHGEIDCANPSCKKSLEHARREDNCDSQVNPTTLSRQIMHKFHHNSSNLSVQASSQIRPHIAYNRSSTPLDTESNINLDEHQESPIDLINDTTKMRHLEGIVNQTPSLCDNCHLKQQIEQKIASPSRQMTDLKVLIVDCRIAGL